MRVEGLTEDEADQELKQIQEEDKIAGVTNPEPLTL